MKTKLQSASAIMPRSSAAVGCAGATFDCAFVKLQLDEIINLQRDAYKQIEAQVHKLREKKGEYKPVGGDEKIIQDTSLFRTKKIIENEKDLDEYILNLRAALKEILKNNKIRVL
jgi:hypothetical protein